LSAADVLPNRRRWVLVRLGHLFAEIDEAFARGDFPSAQAMAPEVAELIQEVNGLVLRTDVSRTSGIRTRER